MTAFRALCAAVLCLPLLATAGVDTITAISRSNKTNFKDRAFASCLSTAYHGSPAGTDADVSKSAFLEWTYYDDAHANPAIDRLVEKYLRRDYSNPVEGYADARFDLLKCVDMYHSRELEDLARQYVPHPDWIGDKPNAGKRK